MGKSEIIAIDSLLPFPALKKVAMILILFVNFYEKLELCYKKYGLLMKPLLHLKNFMSRFLRNYTNWLKNLKKSGNFYTITCLQITKQFLKHFNLLLL